jgi:hypothetical protein
LYDTYGKTISGERLRTGRGVFKDHSSITSAKKCVDGVRKWQFLLIYSTIYADVGGWVGLKKPKNMLT